MARIQKELVIQRLDLKEKYRNEGNRSAMCKAIGKYTQCKIDVRAVPAGVHFEVIGPTSSVIKALRDIKKEFCQPTGDKDGKARSRKVFRCMKKQDQIKILEGTCIIDPGQPLLTEAVLRQHNLLHELRELREFACLRCKHFWWRSVLTMKPVSTCNRCHKRYDALPRDKLFGIGRYICQNSHTFFRFCHATLPCRCMKCYEMVYQPHIHPKYLNRRKFKIRKPVDPDTELFDPTEDPTEEETPQKKAVGDDVSPYERKKKKNIFIFNPSTLHVSTGSTKVTFLTQAGSSAFGDDESTVASSGGDSHSSSDNGSDSDSTLDQSDNDSKMEGSLTTMHSDFDSDTSSNHPNRKRELGTYSSDDSSENGDKTPEPSETGSSGSGKLSSQVSTIQDSGIGTASNIDTVSTADSIKNTAAAAHTSSHGWQRSSTVKPDYFPVRFSRREFRKSINQHGADIIGEGIHVIIPPNAIHHGNEVSVTVQACLEGPFQFPSDYEPISHVYLLHPPYVFQTEVELKIKVFADIEDNDDIIFLTSQDKPTIQKKQNIWIFMEEAGDVSANVQPFSGGCREVSVSVRHFCFGLLARRRKKSQKDLYVVCLYFLLPSWRAIFTASLDSDVYMNDFEDYLEKRFKENRYYGMPRHTRLSDDKIELVLPTSTEVKIVPDSSPCTISKEILDLPKRKKRGTSLLYPPRISMSIHGTSEILQVCTFGVKGTEEQIEFNVEVPPSRSPSLSTHSSRSESSDGPTYQGIVDHVGVSDALLKTRCSSEHLRRIAALVPNWRELAMNLRLKEADIIDIDSNRLLTPMMRAQTVLDRWCDSNSFMASYKMLIEAFIQGNHAGLAERVCKIAKGQSIVVEELESESNV